MFERIWYKIYKQYISEHDVSEMSTGIAHQITFLYIKSPVRCPFQITFFLPDEATAIGDLLKKPVQLGDDGFGDSAGFTYYILQYIYILYGSPQKRYNSNWLTYDYVTTIL